MTSFTSPFALFAVSAGGPLGFGRLSRAGALADALGADRHVILRGPAEAIDVAIRWGWTVHAGSTVLEHVVPDVLIVDDGSSVDVSRYLKQARRLEVPAVTVHDERRVATGSQLSVDGGFVPYEASASRLFGPEFALLDWRVAARRTGDEARDGRRVVIALGAGGRAHQMAADVAATLTDAVPTLRVDVAASATPADQLPPLPATARWVHAPHGLVPYMATAAVVVTSGGMALYESCALGSPTVAVALSPAETRVVDAAARAEVAVTVAGAGARVTPVQVAHRVVDLLADPTAAKALGRRARQLVDGRGASRVADHIRRLLSTTPVRGWSHAA